jgi:hypothetical protein
MIIVSHYMKDCRLLWIFKLAMFIYFFFLNKKSSRAISFINYISLPKFYELTPIVMGDHVYRHIQE